MVFSQLPTFKIFVGSVALMSECLSRYKSEVYNSFFSRKFLTIQLYANNGTQTEMARLLDLNKSTVSQVICYNRVFSSVAN